MTDVPEVIVAVDAGGSGSRVLIRDGSAERVAEFGSVNPASVGAAAAADTLARIASFVAGAAAGRRVSGWWASATIDRTAAGAPARDVHHRLAVAGVDGRFVASNDPVPLLFAPPVSGRGAVLVAGTGSGFLAADGAGNLHVAGGFEYLASDEGSAFDLGLHGVRRAARALDGRGGPTAVLDELRVRHGPDLAGFFRSLALAPDPKRTLAGLAGVVTACWLAGDGAATELVTDAAAHLADGLAAVRGAAGLDAAAPTLLVGGMFTGCPRFAELTTRLVTRRCGAHPVSVAESPVHGVADAAALAAADGPPVSAACGAYLYEFDTAHGPPGEVAR